MGRERDTRRTGVAAVTVTERVAIGMVTVHVMEMVVAMETDTATQKAAAAAAAAAVMLTVTVTGRTGMDEVAVDTERAEAQTMVGMVRAGKRLVTVRVRWTPRWTARWTRWTARQIRQLMVLLSPSHPSARKADGTVRGYVLQCEISCL